MTKQRVKRISSREALQQALAAGKAISERAQTGQGFDPRGGIPVLAAQLATAGIGAFAQNRARKQLAEQELQDKAAFERNFPQFAGLNLSRETREAARGAFVAQQLKGAPTPKFQIKETEAGLTRIDPQTGQVIPITLEGRQLRGKPQKPLVEVKTGEFEKEEQKQLGKVFAKKFEQITQAGDAARRGLETLQTLEVAVSNPEAAQGAFAGIRAESKKIADLFGVKVKGLKDDAIISAVGNKLALQLRNPRGEDGGLTGATSDRDLKFLVQGVPNRDKTQSQNLALIEIGKRDKERTIRLKQLADQYLEENGTFRGFAKVKENFFENNPLFEEGSEDKDNIKRMLSGVDETITEPSQGLEQLSDEELLKQLGGL